MEERNPVRCAVLGIGAQGRKYALMLHRGEAPGLVLSAVCCRSGSSAAWARENLGPGVRIVQDEDGLYRDAGSFDAVIIATPHRQHPAMTVRALWSGKHVLCDKPAGITAADAAAMSEAAARSGRVYALICNQWAYPMNRRIREMLEEERIGKPVRVTQINSRNFRTRWYHESSTWRSSWRGEGGGALINGAYLSAWRGERIPFSIDRNAYEQMLKDRMPG